MRIRLGCLGWLTLGWIIIPLWMLYWSFRGCVELVLMTARAADRYNRRRAVRRAYERDRARREALRRLRAQGGSLFGSQPPQYPQHPWTGEPEDARPYP